MNTIFSVDGPREVPFYQGGAGRTITVENVADFWGRNDELASQRGCYVFGIRAGKGYTPAYVGRATRSFRQEVFAPHKLTRYQQFLADYRRGTPVLFFVVAPRRRGGVSLNHFADVEKFLVQSALAANPELLNVQGTAEAEWGIAGIIRGGKGKPTQGAKALVRLLKLPR